jgi:peptidoglycan/xylan/chitin deacetylase (PgdA/CDA1 family)
MILNKYKYTFGAIVLAALIFSSCSNVGQGNEPPGNASNTINENSVVTKTVSPTITPAKVEAKELSASEIQTIKPNESGKIMVVMFHNFVDTFTETKWDNGEYTTTFSAFSKLLDTLYQANYRPISMDDYLNNNISVAAGKTPIIFTFDDGTSGQFNLIEENGKLIMNPKSAVGIMEAYNMKNPDFGLKGVFYLNLGNDATFSGKGTLSERLQYLIDKGFEIGNHTYSHVNLKEIKDPNKIQKEIGSNQKVMSSLVKDYTLKTFSLPFGIPSGDLKEYVQKGEYEGIKYNNLAIMEVGWQPTFAPGNKSQDLMKVNRVRASGIKPVQADLEWWLKQLSKSEQYISDGNPDTITLPQSKEASMEPSNLKGKKMVTY